MRLSNPPWTREAIVQFTEHDHPMVRRWAVERLAEHFQGESTSDDTEAVIAARVADDDPAVATAAINVAAQLELRGCSDAILARYRSSRGDLPGVAPMTLGLLQDSRLIDVVREREAAGLVDVAEREAAWLGLGALSGPVASEILREAWQSFRLEPDPAAAAPLIEALLATGDPEAVEMVTLELLREHPRTTFDALRERLLLATDHPLTAGELRRLAEGRDRQLSERVVQPCLLGLRALVTAPKVAELLQAWTGGRADQVLRLVADITVALGQIDGFERVASDSFAILETLAARREAAACLDRGRQGEIACLALLALDHVRRCVALALWEPPDDPHELLRLLLTTEHDPLLVDAGLSRLSDLEPTQAMIDACLATLSGVSPHGAIVASRLLGAWGVNAAVPRLVAALGKAPDVTRAALEALVSLGGASLQGISRLIEREGDATRIAAGLELCAAVPSRLAVDLLVANFDRLWRLDPAGLLAATEALGAREFLEPLRSRLSSDDSEAAHVWHLLTAIHGPHDPPRDAIHIGMDADREESIGTSLRLPLKCGQCGSTSTHVVETVYADPERPDLDPFVADRIECRRCGRANDFTLTLEARWVMLAELVRSLALGPDGKPVPSAIKAASIGLEDGRRMSVDEARRDYETRLAGHPDDPGLHVGYANVLRSGKRDAEAAASYRRALALDPDAVEAHASVATLAAEHGDFHEAARGMERCLRSLPRGHFYRLSKNDRAGFIEAVQENLRDFRRLAEVPVAIRVPAQIAAPAAEASHRPPVGRPPVGRNAPCPCGSGKKFKKCCG